MGWDVITVWECELKNPEAVQAKTSAKLAKFQTFRYSQPEPELSMVAEKHKQYKIKK